MDTATLISLVVRREVVIGLALVGAAAVSAGTWLMRGDGNPYVGQALYYGGYGTTGLSVLLFILAGLLGAPG